ncbi:MAG TPA: L,D-transpeptidase [Terracidiphilus sp.]|jgi:lipoprotein-anchoring transpeptidase ErfK/SrfK
MKANGLSNWAVAMSAAMVMGLQAMGQAATTTQTASEQVKRTLVVSLEDRKLAVVEDGQVKRVYTVAVGKPSTPSPVGTFTIQRRVKNPVYQHDGKVIQPGPGNPVGTRWMGLNIKGYGIHGTNEPKSIGKAASHGCIRMARKDLEQIYEMVSVGDTVELVGERNGETAQLFGEPQKPAQAEQPVVVANVEPAATTAPAASVMVATTGNSSDAAESGVAVTGNW